MRIHKYYFEIGKLGNWEIEFPNYSIPGFKLVAIISLLSLYACSPKTYSTHDLIEGKNKKDTSYIYALPFEGRKNVFLLQGYKTLFSHRGLQALDFKVKKRTKICAARDGIVVSTRSDSNKHGLKKENLLDGNYVIVQHSDGTIAMYWHLIQNGVLVKEKDTVKTGQPIALSGNTGFSAFPHLHFEVQGYDENGIYTDIPTRFCTNRGIIYLRSFSFYRNCSR